MCHEILFTLDLVIIQECNSKTILVPLFLLQHMFGWLVKWRYVYVFTLIGFGVLLAKTSKMKKSTFLTNKYTKLKLRHWPKWYLTQKVWIQSYMMLLISLNFTVFIIFVDLLSKYTFIYAGLPIENELKTASKQPIAKNLKVPTRN